MTVANSTIKKTAKDSLKNNKVKAFIVGIILLFVFLINSNICSCVYEIFGEKVANIALIVLNILLLAPVVLGGVRYYWRMLCGVCEDPISVFYYFSSMENYKKAMTVILKLGIKFLIYLFLYNIPYIVVSVILNAEFYEFLNIPIPLWTANLSNIAMFLKSIGIVATIVSMLKYYLTPMLIVVDEHMDVSEALHMSAVISKSTTLDFIFLVFNMLGWILLSLLFIPLIFTLGYFITVYLSHCSYAVNDYNEHIKTLNGEDSSTFVAGI